MFLLKARNAIGKADDVLYNFIAIIEGIILLVLLLTYFLKIISNFVILIPVWWVTDFSILLFLVNTALGMAVAWTRNSHLVLDLTENLFPELVKDIMWWLCQLLMFICGLKLFGLALYNVEVYKEMRVSLLGYPESVKAWVIGIASLLLSLAALFKMIEKILDDRIKNLEPCNKT